MWRALAIVCLVVATAHAEADLRGFACWNVTPTVVPADAATDVARNTSVWIVGGVLGDYTLRASGHETHVHATVVTGDVRIIRVELPLLAPNTTYTVTYDGTTSITTFTTGTTIDHTPPKPPAFPIVEITRSNRGIVLDAPMQPSADTVAISLAVRDRTRGSTLVEVVVPRTGLSKIGDYCLGFGLWSEHTTCVAARSLDAAGNLSEPIEHCAATPAVIAPVSPPPHALTLPDLHSRRTFDGGPPGIAFTILSGLVAGYLACVLLALGARRRYTSFGTYGKYEIHVDTVNIAARRLRTRAFRATLTSAVAIAMTVISDRLDGPMFLVVASPLLAVGVVVVATMLRGHRIVGLVARGVGATTDVRYVATTDSRNIFLVRGDRFLTWLRVSPALFRTPPRAIAQPR